MSVTIEMTNDATADIAEIKNFLSIDLAFGVSESLNETYVCRS